MTKRSPKSRFQVLKGVLLPPKARNFKIGLFCLIFVSLFFGSHQASAIWQNNFDSYSTGYIRDIGINLDTNASTTISINSSKFISSPNSIFFPATSTPIYIITSSTTEPNALIQGQTEFKFYLASGGLADGFIYTLFPESQPLFLVRVKMFADGSIKYYDKSGVGGSYQNLYASSTFPLDAWNTLKINFDIDACYYNVKINSSDWSPDISMNLSECQNSGYDNIRRTGILDEANTSVWTDDFSYWNTNIDTLPEDAILPSYPPDCSFTIVSTTTLSSFNATGTITIPENNIYNWFKFSVIAREFDTATTTYFSTTTDLIGGDTWNYEIPISLPEGAWKVSYILQGLYETEPSYFSHYCDNTGIGTALPLPTWKEITETEFLGLEDCSSYSLLERLVCELKNVVKGIFIPSPQSMNDLKNTIQAFNNKAPMNYIKATRDFLTSVRDGLDSQRELNFKILGQTASVNFDFWDSTTEFNGQNTSFLNIIRILFTCLLGVFYVVYFVKLLNRIFK